MPQGMSALLVADGLAQAVTLAHGDHILPLRCPGLVSLRTTLVQETEDGGGRTCSQAGPGWGVSGGMTWHLCQILSLAQLDLYRFLVFAPVILLAQTQEALLGLLDLTPG